MWIPVLNERAMRRPTFVEGARVSMADGQTWSLSGRRADQADPEYDAMLRVVYEAEDEAEQLRSELALTIFLLSRNYQLTSDAYQDLLDFQPGDPALIEMQQTVHVLAVSARPFVLIHNPAEAVRLLSRVRGYFQAFWPR